MHFKIIAGDISKTSFLSTDNNKYTIQVPKGLFSLKTTDYPLTDNIKTIEQITEENKHNFFAKAGWTTVGAVALGPLGAVAGLLFGGKSKNICCAIELISGEKIVCELDKKMYSDLYVSCLETPLKEEPQNTATLSLDDLKTLLSDGVITEDEYKEKARKLFEQA